MKKIICGIVAFMALFVFLHATPEHALRTNVLTMGYPVSAFTSEISEGPFHHEKDSREFAGGRGKVLIMERPPFERATESDLRQFLVVKRGWLHFASYYGDV
ncbi:hypothetical protein ACTL32_09035 [Planococcus sp. FY231025]|uniref:hypothetical protein n=1 Tax=Planococcus sp. FY231025 TaxID=3455699 RepID=UPI003F921946